MALPDVPLTRGEQYLNRIATGEGTIPDVPLTRLEQYLDYIAKNGGSGGGGEGGETVVDYVSYPLVKTYVAESATSGLFSLPLDKPLKAARILITGVANGDVSAKSSATVQIGVGFTGYDYTKKAMYGQLVSNAAFTALIDVKRDSEMVAWLSDGSFGAVALSNGWLNSKQTCYANADDGDKIYRVNIKPDTTDGVSVTTGMTIKVYGLEA